MGEIMADSIAEVINVDSPQVDAPMTLELNLGGIFTDLKTAIDGIVDDVRSGSSDAITGVFLAGMFVFAGVFLWRNL